MFFVSFYTETMSFLILIITERLESSYWKAHISETKPFDIFHVPEGKKTLSSSISYKGYERVEIAEIIETEPKTREGT